MSQQPHRVVIIGGGFAGLTVAMRLKRAPVQVTLIDRRNFHLFQPLLYQVATGGLSPANIAAPLRSVLRKHANVHVVLGEAVEIDVIGRRVILRDGEVLYDTLILAAGASHQYFGHPEWEALAPGLKSIEDAAEIRRRVLLAFEKAEYETDPKEQAAHLTFVVIGAGPTGVELAGALSEMSRQTMRRDFRNIDSTTARIYLIEGGDRVLPSFVPKLSAAAENSLINMGVNVLKGARVTSIEPHGVTYQQQERTESIPTHTVLWAAGVAGSPLGAKLAQACGVTPDRAVRVPVGPDLTVAGQPNVFVIGDLAASTGVDGKLLPGVAPVAMQQGRYVARVIAARLAGNTVEPFSYYDKGSMATIGRHRAVVDAGWMKLCGIFAWWVWLFIHLLYIVTHQNRFLIVAQWAWNYWTRGRSARLITGTFPWHYEDGAVLPMLANPEEATSRPA